MECWTEARVLLSTRSNLKEYGTMQAPNKKVKTKACENNLK